MATCIDLFAGCGGLSLGLSQAGIRPLLAVEGHPDAFETYRRNLISSDEEARWPNWLPKEAIDIWSFLERHRTDIARLAATVDIVAGGPPCQGFTTNGRRDRDDPRNRLVDAHLEVVALVRPSLVLIENVRGFASMAHTGGGTFPDHVRRTLDSIGYECWYDIVSAADFGVPQRRPRFILLGAPKGSLPGIDPISRLKTSRKSFLQSLGLGSGPTTAREAIGDLEVAKNGTRADPEWGNHGFEAIDYKEPDELSSYAALMRDGADGPPADARLARHGKDATHRMLTILETCPRGRVLSTDDRHRLGIAKRTTTPLDPEAPSPTISTLPDDLVHYSEPRTMTVREHARLQSFPDWFTFTGKYTSGGKSRRVDCPRYTQVGNAVPPLLARAIGQVLLGLLRDQKPTKLFSGLEVLKEAAPQFRESFAIDPIRAGTPNDPTLIGPFLQDMT